MCSTPKSAGLSNHARRVSETSIDYKLLKRASNLADQREREREKNRAQTGTDTTEDTGLIQTTTTTPVIKKRKLTKARQNSHGMARFLEWLRPFYS